MAGAVAMLAGMLALLFRVRVLRFVRGRYARVHREDGLSGDESLERMPRMWMLLAIASGYLAFGILSITVGLMSAGAIAQGADAMGDQGQAALELALSPGGGRDRRVSGFEKKASNLAREPWGDQ
ncbi:hypothetical protein [Microbacterium azadirachtae]|uniref:hypothetical protein n=1 Tax=Microbacterium azadirachtae TaxID=582680 RepID=UPI001269962E|nr:hypothetical protein [Microbacterium azadirachtae]